MTKWIVTAVAVSPIVFALGGTAYDKIRARINTWRAR